MNEAVEVFLLVLDEVKDAVRTWPRFASEADVRDEFAAAISRRLGVEMEKA